MLNPVKLSFLWSSTVIIDGSAAQNSLFVHSTSAAPVSMDSQDLFNIVKK